MSLVRHILIATVFMLLLGCTESDLCSSRRTAMSDKHAALAVLSEYCSYRESLNRPGPPLGASAEPLGRRGRDAVVLWIEDMETGNGLYKNWEYGPILSYARDYTGYRVCSDKALLKRAKAGLVSYHRGIHDNEAKSMIAAYC